MFYPRPPYQGVSKLQVGAEFHRATESQGLTASSSIGVGLWYEVDKSFHLLGYIRRGIENTEQTDRYSCYASISFTF